jgi:hypothetical protein
MLIHASLKKFIIYCNRSKFFKELDNSTNFIRNKELKEKIWNYNLTALSQLSVKKSYLY